MTPAELLTLPFSGQTVAIIGNPATGKTWLSNEIARRTGSRVIHADDYIEHGYKDALYVLLDDVTEADAPLIVEGVQCYRLLRQGVQLDCFYPDVVIELTATDEQVMRVYEKERMFDKRRSIEQVMKSLSGFNKMHQTILADYRILENPQPPTWWTVENKF